MKATHRQWWNDRRQSQSCHRWGTLSRRHACAYPSPYLSGTRCILCMVITLNHPRCLIESCCDEFPWSPLEAASSSSPPLLRRHRCFRVPYFHSRPRIGTAIITHRTEDLTGGKRAMCATHEDTSIAKLCRRSRNFRHDRYALSTLLQELNVKSSTLSWYSTIYRSAPGKWWLQSNRWTPKRQRRRSWGWPW